MLPINLDDYKYLMRECYRAYCLHRVQYGLFFVINHTSSTYLHGDWPISHCAVII